MSLPDKHEPLKLADGTVIDPSTGKPQRQRRQYTEIPSRLDAVRQVTAVRRKLSDLPAPPKEMNALSLVCFYSMMGLGDEEIGIAMGITALMVGRIRMHESYSDVKAAIVNSIVEEDAADVRSLLARSSIRAAQKLDELVESEHDMVALSAANSMLDRSGHRPVDIIEHRHRIEDRLVIEIIKKDESNKIPDVSVDYVEMEG